MGKDEYQYHFETFFEAYTGICGHFTIIITIFNSILITMAIAMSTITKIVMAKRSTLKRSNAKPQQESG